MSQEPYITLAGRGESEQTVERSRFLGIALPIVDLDEALAFVKATRSKHYNARHVCYGLRLGQGSQGIDRSNDDGEPARTGGFPLWQLLDGENVTHALLVVVRYYGGIKLGTGGLARAYRETGRLALKNAGLETRYPERLVDLTLPYSVLDTIQYTLESQEAVRLIDTAYGAEVTLRLAIRLHEEDSIRQLLAGLLQRDPHKLYSDANNILMEMETARS